MLLPDSMELRICVPYNSRSTAWASFDGRGRVELRRKFSAVSDIFLFSPGSNATHRMDRGRPYQSDGIAVPVPNSLRRQAVDRLVWIDPAHSQVERATEAEELRHSRASPSVLPRGACFAHEHFCLCRRKVERGQRSQGSHRLRPHRSSHLRLPRLFRSILDSPRLAMVLLMRKTIAQLLSPTMTETRRIRAKKRKTRNTTSTIFQRRTRRTLLPPRFLRRILPPSSLHSLSSATHTRSRLLLR